MQSLPGNNSGHIATGGYNSETETQFRGGFSAGYKSVLLSFTIQIEVSPEGLHLIIAGWPGCCYCTIQNLQRSGEQPAEVTNCPSMYRSTSGKRERTKKRSRQTSNVDL
ncbi:MAG TPA: hypothetical protein VGE26_00985 [Sphingobacteriaceae bacterium]